MGYKDNKVISLLDFNMNKPYIEIMRIYKVTNKFDGKIYIGQTVQDLKTRWRDHMRGSKRAANSYLHNAIIKYGDAYFTVEEIDTATTLEGLNALEEYYINKFNSLSPNGYNLLPGGENRRCHPDTRVKISETMKGRQIPNRWEKGNSIPHSPETKAKISETMKKKDVSTLFGGKRQVGRQKGFKLSEERKQALSKAFKGKPMKANRKKVLEVETGKVYDSVNECADFHKVNRVTISSLIKSGKIGRMGFSFKFL